MTRIVVHAAARDHAKVAEARALGADVMLVEDRAGLAVGSVPVSVLHTPGHQPEAACFLAGAADGAQALFTGDTLFIDTCGRTDFPGGDTDALFRSMARLRALEGDPVVLPGHHYADRPRTPLSAQCKDNPALSTLDREGFGALPFLRG